MNGQERGANKSVNGLERGEERRGVVITTLGLNTCLLDSTGIEMRPELTAFITSFPVLGKLLSGWRKKLSHLRMHAYIHTFLY